MNEYCLEYFNFKGVFRVLKKGISLVVLLVGMFSLAACDEGSYTVSLTSELDNAQMSIEPSDTVDEGEEVTISAFDTDDHVFVEWVDVASDETFSEESTYTFTPENDLVLEAVYEAIDPEDNGDPDDNGDSDDNGDNGDPDDNGDNGDPDDNGDNDAPLSDEAQAAQDVYEAFDNDLAHLSSLMNEMDSMVGQRMSMTLDFTTFNEWEESYESGTLSMSIAALETGGSDLMHLTFSFEDDHEAVDLELYINETQMTYEVYFEVSDMLELMSEDDVDFSEIFDIDEYIVLVLPKEDADFDEDDLYEMLAKELDMDEAVLRNVANELSRFEKYFDLEYFEALDGMELDVEVHDETMVNTIMTLHPESIKALANDVLEDMFYIANMLDMDEEMPEDFEAFKETEEYQQLMAMIDFIDPFDLVVSFEPYHNDSMSMMFNVMDMIPSDPNESMQVTMSLQDASAISVPSDARNLLDLGEEFFKLMMLGETYRYAETLEMFSVPEGTHTVAEIQENHFVNFGLPIIDPELSEVTIEADEMIFDFVYITSSEAVFKDGEISLTTLEMIHFEDTPPQDRAEFLASLDYIENVDMFEKLEYLIGFAMHTFDNDFEEGFDDVVIE